MARRAIKPEDYYALRIALGLDPNATLNIKERLRELRMEHSLTLDQVADICGVAGRGVTGPWEREGEQNPELQTIFLLADFYGVSMDWVIGRAGAERDSPAVIAGKQAINTKLHELNLQDLTPGQRVARVWEVVQEVASHAFPRRRVAGLIGIDAEVFDNLVSGQLTPSPVVVNRFAFALGIPEELLRKK